MTNATTAEPGSRCGSIPGARPSTDDAQPTTVNRAAPFACSATTFSQIKMNARPHQTARRNQMPAATNRPEYATAARDAASSVAHATPPAPATSADTASGSAVSGTTSVTVASTAAAGSCQRATGFSHT